MSKIYFLNKKENFDVGLTGERAKKLEFLSKNDIKTRDGLIFSTEVYDDFLLNKDIDKLIDKQIKLLEEQTYKKLGGNVHPLILTISGDCKSGKKGLLHFESVGLNESIVKKLGINKVGQAYIEFIRYYAQNVKGQSCKFYKMPANLDYKKTLEKFKRSYKRFEKEDFPQDVNQIVKNVIKACFKSNASIRMNITRELLGVDKNEKCSVILQESFLGEKVVQASAYSRVATDELKSIKYKNCQILTCDKNCRFDEKIKEKISKTCKKLEKIHKNVVKINFFVKKGRVIVDEYVLPELEKQHFVKALCDLNNDKIISKEDAVLRLTPKIVSGLLHSEFEFFKSGQSREFAKGLPASPGAACGRICLSAEYAKKVLKQGNGAILVCNDTSPEELEGLKKLNGLLAARGGMTSHASVVARGMGVPCVVGCNSLKIDYAMKEISLAGRILKEGVFISIDGTSGKVYDRELRVVPPSISADFEKVLGWADKIAKLEVRTNADNGKDALTALRFGAKGIGLCRTEHMFFEKDRIKYMREMIVADNTTHREKALAKILPIQKDDFISLFTVMKNYPVTIRLLDPPLHEFLPKDEKSISELAKDLNEDKEKLQAKINSLKEFNPMMGHRGLRLAITYPEIAKMQTEAIISAAIELNKKGYKIEPEIMIPLTSGEKEFEFVRNIVKNHADLIISQQKTHLKYKIGSMIELPRACLVADKIAKTAQFFSFGTNDLSQMTFGMSRDDSGKFLEEYYAKGILNANPFKSLDTKGVGKLVKMACQLGKSARKDLKVGVCGEQGGDPSSIDFFDKIGLDYVSCSPYRVPVARVAAAQATIKNRTEN